MEMTGIRNFVLSDQGRAHRGKGIKALASAKLASAKFLLPVSGRDIICCGVAEHKIQCVGLANVLTIAADHDGQFAFVIDFCTGEMGGDHDRVPGIRETVWRFYENQRAFRELYPLLRWRAPYN